MKRASFQLLGALLILLVLEAVLFGIFYARFHLVGYNGDALYDAQVARNVLAGKGYTTNEMPLYALNLYERSGFSLEPPWSNTHKFPLPVFVKAGLFALFGDSLFVATYLYSYVFHTLALLTLFWLAYGVFRSVANAFVAGLLFLSHPALFFGTRFMMAGLNLTADIFFFLVLLAAVVWWVRSGKRSALILLGVVAGIAFLNRFNAGLYLPALGLFLVYYFRSGGAALRAALWQTVKSGTLIALGFAVTIATFSFLVGPSVAVNPARSINGLFQLFFETKFNSFIDPWYKLEYVFSTANPLAFALSHPTALLEKWVRYAAINPLRFFTFERTWWWLVLLPLVFVFMRKREGEQPHQPLIRVLAVFVALLVALQTLVLPFWSGGIGYYFHLFSAAPLMLTAVVSTLWEVLTEMRISAGGALSAVRARPLISALAVAALAALLFSAFFPIFIQAAQGVRLFALAGVGAAVLLVLLTLWSFPRLGIGLVLAAMVFSPVARAGVFGPPLVRPERATRREAEPRQTRFPTSPIDELEERWDLEDDPQALSRLMPPARDGIILALAPWNVVWFARGRASLPLPEYPDEAYLLETRYQQRVAALYVKKLEAYTPELRPYAWQAYERMQALGVAPAGYRFAERLPDGFLAVRTGVEPVRETLRIDIGSAEASSHLIWGWGSDEVEVARSFVWAGRAGRPESRPRPIPIPSDLGPSFFQPDAEVTFLLDQKKPTELTVVVEGAVPQQSVEVILNGNLFAAESPGSYLGKRTIAEQGRWATLIFPLSEVHLKSGLNKLSFRFGGEDDQGRAVAFDSIELRVKQ